MSHDVSDNCQVIDILDAFTAEVAFETLVAIFNGFACFVCSIARKVVHKFEAINHTVFEQTKNGKKYGAAGQLRDQMFVFRPNFIFIIAKARTA